MIGIQNLRANVEGKNVLDGINMEIKEGEIVALMGPNGSGKSSLSNVIIGNPKYEVEAGKIIFEGIDITKMSVDERARLGIMMSFQHPVAIPGVTVRELILSALRQRGQTVSALEVKKEIEAVAADLNLEQALLNRGVNDGFSGGERKKLEVLQMKVLKPKLLIVDEIDSGLDIDALKVVAKGIMDLVEKEKSGVLLITHYQRLLKFLKPDRVVVLRRGKIVENGGLEIVTKLEESGYQIYE